MGKIAGRRHTREFKISIIRELESGKNPVQLSRENNIHPTMIFRWRLEYRKNPESAFSGNCNTYKETVNNHELERLVDKLYSENEFSKKVLIILEKRIQKKQIPKAE
ncbi:MAG: transposase [Candidatus Methanoperedens sp.]|nr:transposase [Candidatus Methanoperedens sp.]MCZ7371868.1 transposase [Candidatus Methanoperedens sp.]